MRTGNRYSRVGAVPTAVQGEVHARRLDSPAGDADANRRFPIDNLPCGQAPRSNVMSDRRYWVVGRSGLVVLALIAIGVLAIIGYFAYGGFAQQSGERFVVTLQAEQKPGVASAVEALQRRGFTPV